MYKGKGIIGKPVVSIDSGDMVDRIKDVFFDASSRKVLGFLVDEGGILASARVLPFESIQVIGPDGVLIPTAEAIVRAQDAAHGREILNEDNVVVGTKIMTEDGKDLGSISDIFFDEMNGMIEGYEVTGGIFADAVSGKSYLPSSAAFRIGRDVAFVPAGTDALIEAQVGGLEAMTTKTQESMRGAGAALQETTGDVTAAVKKAWEKAKEMAADATGMASDKIEEKRISAALGRPVTRVILDPNDQPILNTGDLITNEAVTKARAAGVLDMLLSSAYTTDPEFSSDELKAKPQETGSNGETAA